MKLSNTRSFRINLIKFSGSLFLGLYLVGCRGQQDKTTSQGESSVSNADGSNCRIDENNGFTVCDQGTTLGTPYAQSAEIDKPGVRCATRSTGENAPVLCDVPFKGWIDLPDGKITNGYLTASCEYVNGRLNDVRVITGDTRLHWQCPQDSRGLK
jgi:hypothetical protein